jgi:DNA polymerase
VTEAERRAALEAIAAEVRACTRCRLHEGRTQAVPGEGHPSTEVVFVGEGPGFHEDRQGRPFVGRAGDLLVRLLGSIGWRREDVFITNIVKCRPPDNRDPEPDEVAACALYLRRQLEALDPALVVTLGRHSMARFMPGTTISRAHGTVRPADPATGVDDALVFAMYHPAAALRTPAIEEASFADVVLVPRALEEARAHRDAVRAAAPAASLAPEETSGAAAAPPGDAADPDVAQASPPPPATPAVPQRASPDPAVPPEPEPPAVDQLTLFR